MWVCVRVRVSLTGDCSGPEPADPEDPRGPAQPGGEWGDGADQQTLPQHTGTPPPAEGVTRVRGPRLRGAGPVVATPLPPPTQHAPTYIHLCTHPYRHAVCARACEFTPEHLLQCNRKTNPATISFVLLIFFSSFLSLFLLFFSFILLFFSFGLVFFLFYFFPFYK